MDEGKIWMDFGSSTENAHAKIEEWIAKMYGTHPDLAQPSSACFRADEPPLRTMSDLQRDALYALAERDSGDPEGKFYRLVSGLLACFPRATREQIEEQIALLAS